MCKDLGDALSVMSKGDKPFLHNYHGYKHLETAELGFLQKRSSQATFLWAYWLSCPWSSACLRKRFWRCFPAMFNSQVLWTQYNFFLEEEVKMYYFPPWVTFVRGSKYLYLLIWMTDLFKCSYGRGPLPAPQIVRWKERIMKCLQLPTRAGIRPKHPRVLIVVRPLSVGRGFLNLQDMQSVVQVNECLTILEIKAVARVLKAWKLLQFELFPKLQRDLHLKKNTCKVLNSLIMQCMSCSA